MTLKSTPYRQGGQIKLFFTFLPVKNPDIYDYARISVTFSLSSKTKMLRS